MSGLTNFNVVDVLDPAELDERSAVSDRLSGRNTVHHYMIRDPAAARSAPGAVLSRYATRQAGDLQLSLAGDRFGTEIGISGDGMGAYCFGLLRTGSMLLSTPGRREPVLLLPGSGPLHAGAAGTQMSTADGTTRTNVWIAAHRFERALQASIGMAPRRALVFEPRIDWHSQAGASLRRTLGHLVVEFGRAGGLADNPLALTGFIDLFVHTALQGLPHNFTASLEADRAGPAPAHLRRAEAFFRSQADQPIRLEDAASAAGCSVRTLQRAFHTFRGTSAHAALRAVRLARAREDLAADRASIAEVARRYGFTHRGRFVRAYAREFAGETPAEAVAQRTRRR